MSRAAWVIWCIAWSLFWLTAGWLFLPVINVFFAGASLLAILFPVGKEQTERCHVCNGSFPAQNIGLHLQVRHGVGIR